MIELHINGNVFELCETPFSEIRSNQEQTPKCADILMIWPERRENGSIIKDNGVIRYIQPAIRIGAKRYYPKNKE